MIEFERDRKARNNWVITRIDSEGFHRQLNVTAEDMDELTRQWCEQKTYSVAVQERTTATG